MGKTKEFIDSISDTDECVEWPYAKRNGYGVVRRNRRNWKYV